MDDHLVIISEKSDLFGSIITIFPVLVSLNSMNTDNMKHM